MATPSIAHFGTTLVEAPPPQGVAQKDVPVTGALAKTLRFLEIFGFEPLVENFYPDVGRQFIWRRGRPEDVDYVEKDNFTSYRAQQRPPADAPRAGDTVFRLTHEDPLTVWRAWQGEGLANAVDRTERDQFVAGDAAWLLLVGPDGQTYELGPTQAHAADNHCVYVWTPQASADQVAAGYAEHFGLVEVGHRRFHGLGDARLLRRESPGATLGLLCRDQDVTTRWTDDIFQEAGYSHFRLGALSMERTLAESREAFPRAGDVAFVYFGDSYLELVQAN